MRWIVFVIFAYVMLGMQIGMGDQLRIGGAGPNLVVLAVGFICLNTAREPALAASFVLGLLQDLASSTAPIGLHAFAYSVVGLLIARSNRQVYSDHPLTHLFTCLLAQTAVALIVLGHSYLRPPDGATHLAVMPLLGSCVYTAALAPLVLGVLSRVKPLFGFEPVRRRIRPY
jgi:rod shape-determining protein MreD